MPSLRNRGGTTGGIVGDLKPWAIEPFELIAHAEEHRRAGSDFDRRMALISFDNSIELSITTFLSLHPSQRDGLELRRVKVENWLRNYHGKLDFLEHYVTHTLNQQMRVSRDVIVYYHGIRNDLYHGGNGMAPAEQHVNGIRDAAIWVFDTLFTEDAVRLLEDKVSCSSVEHGQASVSIETEFLGELIALRQGLHELLLQTALGDERIQATDVREAWRRLPAPVEIHREYDELLRQAEELRDAVVEGKPLEGRSEDAKSVHTKLDAVSNYVDTQLREFQRGIIDGALQATLSAQASPTRSLGIVRQATGTGVTLTTLSYIMRAASEPELHLPTILVLGDRNVLLQQLYSALTKTDESVAAIAHFPSDTARLWQLLEMENQQIIFVTAQRLASLLRRGELDRDHLLVVGYSLRRGLPSLYDLLPKALFILFVGHEMAVSQGLAAVFGENTIAEYTLRNAAAQGPLAPRGKTPDD
jgi:hypothetical protein